MFGDDLQVGSQVPLHSCLQLSNVLTIPKHRTQAKETPHKAKIHSHNSQTKSNLMLKTHIEEYQRRARDVRHIREPFDNKLIDHDAVAVQLQARQARGGQHAANANFVLLLNGRSDSRSSPILQSSNRENDLLRMVLACSTPTQEALLRKDASTTSAFAPHDAIELTLVPLKTIDDPVWFREPLQDVCYSAARRGGLGKGG